MEKEVDIAVVGCGPAGLSAAVNIKVRNRSLLLAGPIVCSPPLQKAHLINNYLGVPSVSGKELIGKFLSHAQEMGIELTQGNVTGIYPGGGNFLVQLQDSSVMAKAVVLTTGVLAAKLLPGEEQLVGRGVSYCGTCDAMFYRDSKIAVVSSSPEHEDEAFFLAEVASHVYYIPMYKELDETRFPSNITILRDKVVGLDGGERLEAVSLAQGGKLNVEAAFLLKDQVPMTQMVPGLETAEGYVKVDRQLATNIEGLFAAGDITGKPHQVAKAVGEGQHAALSAVSYVDSLVAGKRKE